MSQTELPTKRSPKEWWVRQGLLLFSVFVAHFGVALFILSGLGSDCFTVFVQGVAGKVGLTIGTVHRICLVGIILGIALFARDFLRLGTIIASLYGGMIIDLHLGWLTPLITEESSLLLRATALLVGLLVLSIGTSIGIKSDAGIGPNVMVALILTDKLKRYEFRWVKMALDALYLVLGFVFGGIAGVGTILSVFVVGPVVQQFLPHSHRLTQWVLRTFHLTPEEPEGC